MVAPARRLDLGLREARNRVVAHRRDAHSEMVSWDADDAVTVVLTNIALYHEVRDEIRTEVTESLRAAERRLGTALAASGARRPMPPENIAGTFSSDRIRRSFDWLHRNTDHLDGESRRLVARSHRIAGYETLSPLQVGRDVLRLTGAVADASPTDPK
jgi:hypothetical protein